MKRLCTFIVNMILMVNLALGMAASAETETGLAAERLKIGDYFILGKYNEEPIVWRYVVDDEYGKLILSDKIICFKPFDVPGENNSGSHARYSFGRQYSRGNNYWGDSNIRSWLNSAELEGQVIWMCGNPPSLYKNEKGFLAEGNFSKSQRNVIKSVTQKSLLDIVDAELAVGGSADIWENYKLSTNGYVEDGEIIYGDVINPVENQYDEICFEYVTDLIFLMDIKQCWAVHENEDILGKRYCHAKPTQKALNDYKYGQYHTIEEEMLYFLRTPLGRPHQINKDTMSAGDQVLTDDGGCQYAIDSHGIRPAFYLNEETAVIVSGSGTAEEPYVINGEMEDGAGDETEQEEASTEMPQGIAFLWVWLRDILHAIVR